MASGLVIGKFMPPHAGHQYLIDFARHFVEELTVQVCAIRAEPIPGSLRYAWVRDSFGGVRVLLNDDENPQEPADCPDRFWEIWRESLLARMDRPPDYLFASEEYGLKLAELLGAQYLPVDPRRELVPISATAIRGDPMRYWDYLLPEARPYFLRRVAIIGPESSGKSTLTAALAAHYGTRHVSEYGRTYLDAMGLEIDADAIANIARGHRAAEEAMARQCRRLLFSDTESIITRLWSQILLGHVPEIVEQYVREDRYALYLVTAATEEWEADPQRFQPEASARREFEARCIQALEALDRPYLLLRGDGEQRRLQAVAAVDALLRRPGHR